MRLGICPPATTVVAQTDHFPRGHHGPPQEAKKDALRYSEVSDSAIGHIDSIDQR